MELLQCLQGNQALVGKECSNLGKKCKTGWLGRHKILLSYDEKNGWNVVKLNIFQIFFRKVFGCYKNTHLDYIAKHCRNVKSDDPKIIACQGRIQALWNTNFLVAYGNTDLAHAQVICFAEAHTDETFRVAIGGIIDSYYEDGDAVLVEGLSVGEYELAAKNEQTFFSKKEYMIQGWEPKNFDEIPNNVYAKAKINHRQFVRQTNKMVELCQNQPSHLENELESYIISMRNLQSYYQVPQEIIGRRVDLIRNLFEKIKESSFNQDEIVNFQYALFSIINALRDEMWKSYDSKIGSAELSEVTNLRNHSLAQQTAKNCGKNKRVFDIAGVSHLLKCRPPQTDNQNVKDELKKHSFVIITNKKYLSRQLLSLNTDLNPQALYLKGNE